jgi:hypothetical protein
MYFKYLKYPQTSYTLKAPKPWNEPQCGGVKVVHLDSSFEIEKGGIIGKGGRPAIVERNCFFQEKTDLSKASVKKLKKLKKSDDGEFQISLLHCRVYTSLAAFRILFFITVAVPRS